MSSGSWGASKGGKAREAGKGKESSKGKDGGKGKGKGKKGKTGKGKGEEEEEDAHMGPLVLPGDGTGTLSTEDRADILDRTGVSAAGYRTSYGFRA